MYYIYGTSSTNQLTHCLELEGAERSIAARSERKTVVFNKIIIITVSQQ